MQRLLPACASCAIAITARQELKNGFWGRSGGDWSYLGWFWAKPLPIHPKTNCMKKKDSTNPIPNRGGGKSIAAIHLRSGASGVLSGGVSNITLR
ncbi:hypothetical protein Pnap_3101 [Polaromonas naphthalenivorans CJ2]|uniref:Uncharacterized protein n=1 Tax=Polaromonas naphthalenivorans (strain CJ2) TaxID=365044 RepID=A1VRX2_POLNA|nr:hypothetical protein Pnap_3101 [Polaromonas naphthalenivorans CJ2]